MGEAPSEIVVGPSFSARLANVGLRRLRLPNRLMLGSYVLPQEWDRPSANTVALSLKAARKIINRWSSFDKKKSSIVQMRDLYPTLLRVPVATRAKDYSIPFPGYLDRKSFQHVAEDEMLIHNHDFNELAELVCFNF